MKRPGRYDSQSRLAFGEHSRRISHTHCTAVGPVDTFPQGRSGSLAVRALGLSSSASGDTARSNPKQQRRHSLSGYGQLALDSNTLPDVPILVLPLLCWRIGPTLVRVGALPIACAAATDETSLILLTLAWVFGGPECSDVPELVVSGLAQSHSYSRRSQFAGCAQKPHRCSPLSRDANKSTDLGASSGGRADNRRRRSSSGVESSKCLEREHVEHRHPAEVERVDPAKRRAVSSKGEHAAFCIRRESAGSIIHSCLSSSDKVLCAPGCAWARGSRRGQLIKRELGEAADPALYTLLLL